MVYESKTFMKGESPPDKQEKLWVMVKPTSTIYFIIIPNANMADYSVGPGESLESEASKVSG